MAGRRKPNLTRLEGDVMRAVWDASPRPVRVREVADALNGARREPLAYTTIQTVLTILKDKGVVQTVEGPGRAHLFKAKVSRDQASRHMVRELADRLFGGRVRPLLHQLIDQSDMTPEELAELRRFIDERLRDSEGRGGSSA